MLDTETNNKSETNQGLGLVISFAQPKLLGAHRRLLISYCSVFYTWKGRCRYTNKYLFQLTMKSMNVQCGSCFFIQSLQKFIFVFVAYFVCSYFAINTQCMFVLKSLMCNLGQKSHMFIWVFPKIGVPQNGWLKMETPIKMDDLGGKTHYFRKPPFGHQLFRNQFTPRSPGILLSAAGQWIEGYHWFRSCMWQGTWDRISGNPKCRSSKKCCLFFCVFFFRNVYLLMGNQ